MDVLLIDCFFDDLSGAEGDVSGWVEIDGFASEGSEPGSCGFDFSELRLI